MLILKYFWAKFSKNPMKGYLVLARQLKIRSRPLVKWFLTRGQSWLHKQITFSIYHAKILCRNNYPVVKQSNVGHRPLVSYFSTEVSCYQYIDYCSSVVDSYRNLDSMSILWLYYQMQLSRCILSYDILANFNVIIGYI